MGDLTVSVDFKLAHSKFVLKLLMHQGQCIFKLILSGGTIFTKTWGKQKEKQHPNYVMFIKFHPKHLLILQPPRIVTAVSLCLSETELKTRT